MVGEENWVRLRDSCFALGLLNAPFRSDTGPCCICTLCVKVALVLGHAPIWGCVMPLKLSPQVSQPSDGPSDLQPQ